MNNPGPCLIAVASCLLTSFALGQAAGAAAKSAAEPAAAAPARATEETPLARVGDSRVLKWKDGKAAVFFLAFDDACPTHISKAYPELQKRGLVGTFYPICKPGLFNDNPNWMKLAATPHVELGNHTYSHGNLDGVAALDEELKKARAEINKRLPNRKPDRLMSFAQPGGVKWTNISKEELKEALDRNNLVSRPPFWGGGIHVKTAADAAKLVDQAIAKGESGHLDFHGVGGDWLPTPMDVFTEFLDKLVAERDHLWVTDHLSSHKYATERKSAVVKTIQAEKSRIMLQLTSSANPELYDQPLTLRTRVPADWKEVTIKQGDLAAKARPIEGIVQYDAVPGQQEIILSPKR